MAKLHFYYSAMNAGKSTVLLQSSYNYQERGIDTLLYAPKFDDRYGQGKIASRIGLTADAVGFELGFDFYQHVSVAVADNPNIGCVLVDEAQFMSREQVKQLCDITIRHNIPVLAYGLRTDFRAEPFEGSQYLLAWADQVIEIKTICHCGKKATMNLRVDADGKPVRIGEQVEIGGNERYVATCREHYERGQVATVPLSPVAEFK